MLNSTWFDPARSNLPTVLRDLGAGADAGRLRFGGNSLDRVTAWTPDPATPLPSWAHARVTPDDLRRLGALSATTGWRVDLGLRLGHSDPTAAADEAASAQSLIGPGLATIEIGNEPDLFGGDPTLTPAGYTYQQYRADVAGYRAAIDTAAPGLVVAGPDTAGLSWLTAYATDAANAPQDVRRPHGGLAFLTQHFYPLTRCGGAHPTIAELLSPTTDRRQRAFIDAAVAAGRGHGLEVRLDETNSASCGGQDGVSNTLASALWMVQYLLVAAQHGVAGVDVHGGLGVCRGYTPLCVPGATGPVASSSPGVDAVADASLGAALNPDGRLAAQPDFYALLLVHQLEGGRWLPLSFSRSTPLQAFALQLPDGSVRIAVVNLAPSAGDTVVIRATPNHGPATVLRLTGPALQATSQIQFGGNPVSPDGSWLARPGQELPITPTGVHLDVSPASAALLALPPRAVLPPP